jgi:hypothetical protein
MVRQISHRRRSHGLVFPSSLSLALSWSTDRPTGGSGRGIARRGRTARLSAAAIGLSVSQSVVARSLAWRSRRIDFCADSEFGGRPLGNFLPLTDHPSPGRLTLSPSLASSWSSSSSLSIVVNAGHDNYADIRRLSVGEPGTSLRSVGQLVPSRRPTGNNRSLKSTLPTAETASWTTD